MRSIPVTSRPQSSFSSVWTRATRAASRLSLRWWVRVFARHRLGRVVIEPIAGRPIVVLPTIFNPRLFRSGAILAETLTEHLVPMGSSVLDLGTGSGVLGIVAARWAARVVAIDLNPEAIRCARVNALLNHCEDRFDAREGDLFDPVGSARFDVVLFNPPYYRGTPTSEFDRAWRSNDAVDRFAGRLSDHLVPGGRALVILSTDGETSAFLDLFRRSGLTVEAIAERVYPNETFTVYSLDTGRSPSC